MLKKIAFPYRILEPLKKSLTWVANQLLLCSNLWMHLSSL